MMEKLLREVLLILTWWLGSKAEDQIAHMAMGGISESASPCAR